MSALEVEVPVDLPTHTTSWGHATSTSSRSRSTSSSSRNTRFGRSTARSRSRSSGSVGMMVSDAERHERDQHRGQYRDDGGDGSNEVTVLGVDSPSFGCDANGDFGDDAAHVDRNHGDDYSSSGGDGDSDGDGDGDGDLPRQPAPYANMACHDERLRLNTDEVLDEDRIPIGDLTPDDVGAIAGLMSAWARTKTRRGAHTVEKLLKRIVDDINAGNMEVKVTTRMYVSMILLAMIF